MFSVNVDSELTVDSRPFHWSRDFTRWYLGRSHSAEKRAHFVGHGDLQEPAHSRHK